MVELGGIYNGHSTLWKIRCSSLALAFTYHNYNIQSTAGPVVPFFNLHSLDNISSQSLRMRSSTASLVLAFCAILAVQAAPASANVPALAVRGFGTETRDLGVDFEERDVQGLESREPKKLVMNLLCPFYDTKWNTDMNLLS
jgi:hypothetical protein